MLFRSQIGEDTAGAARQSGKFLKSSGLFHCLSYPQAERIAGVGAGEKVRKGLQAARCRDFAVVSTDSLVIDRGECTLIYGMFPYRLLHRAHASPRR